MKTIFTILLTLVATDASAEIYKCRSSSGTVAYQAEPCPGGTKTGIPAKARPLPIAQTTTAEPLRQPSQTERDLAQAKAFEDERISRETERLIHAQEAVIEEAQRSQAQELTDLRAKQAEAKNNLAGATWLQSLAQEMQAVTIRYQSEIQEARAKIAALKSTKK